MRQRRQQGFSLIELMIVVAIILIIAAIAIPNLLRARMAANESSAIASLREIRTSETIYSGVYSTIGFAVQLSHLGGAGNPCVPGPTSACLIDNGLATAAVGSAGKSGYGFGATGLPTGAVNSDYVGGGVPLTPGSSGSRDFCNTTGIAFRYQTSLGAPPVATAGACQGFPFGLN
jgi:type IV pilus assembly protein PilA